MHKRLLLLALPLLVAQAAHAAGYKQTNLIASSDIYGAANVDPTLLNAWGIAIRPAGLGGHFWVTANGTGLSSQWVGDVGGIPLYQDALRIVSVPGPVGQQGTPTGVAFNGGAHFRITQGTIVDAPAKFLFATDNGVISGWTERKNADGSFDWPADAKTVIDASAAGVQYFGIGVDEAGGRLYAANFGANPGMRVYDSAFADITATAGFANPFGGGYEPFNVQALEGKVFVTYAKWGTPGEEETGAGIGRLAEFDFGGSLVRTWGDGTGLNAPWGLAFAPGNFGALSNHLLVSNFGDGTIAALDPASGEFADFVRDDHGDPIAIEGIWGLQFGNGASLGEANRLYFAAGPEDETAGLFGHLAVVPEPSTHALLALGALGLAFGRRRRRQRLR